MFFFLSFLCCITRILVTLILSFCFIPLIGWRKIEVVVCRDNIGNTLCKMEVAVSPRLSGGLLGLSLPCCSVFAPNCCFLISTLLIFQPCVKESKDKGESNGGFCKIGTFCQKLPTEGGLGELWVLRATGKVTSSIGSCDLGRLFLKQSGFMGMKMTLRAVWVQQVIDEVNRL